LSQQILGRKWGETHDYFVTLEVLVDEIIRQDGITIATAVRSALEQSGIRLPG
jgi:hypothetical protein